MQNLNCLFLYFISKVDIIMGFGFLCVIYDLRRHLERCVVSFFFFGYFLGVKIKIMGFLCMIYHLCLVHFVSYLIAAFLKHS